MKQTISANAARMAMNPPSAALRVTSGPACDDGSEWRKANGQRALERDAINGR